jgi:hypothetical protein
MVIRNIGGGFAGVFCDAGAKATMRHGRQQQ